MSFPIAEFAGHIRSSSVTDGNEVCAADRGSSVLFLNRSYWPDVEATGQLLTSLCEGLSQDFNVGVVAGRPNAI